MTIEAVWFDADGVLQYPRRPWLSRMRRVLGPNVSIAELFAAEVSCLTGERDLRAEIAHLLARDGVEAGAGDKLLDVWYDVALRRGALGVLDRLRRRGVRTYLATNQQSYRGAHMQANLPYAARMDGVFYSYELGHAKPSPAFFQAILDATQDEPSSVLFIDDVEANVEGARAVGVHAAWVDRDLGFAEVRRVLSEHGLDHEPEPARR